MLKIPLRLRPSKRANHSIAQNISVVRGSEDTPKLQPAGMFIPGADSAKWLTVIAAGQLSHHLLKLIVIPHTQQNRLPLGVLVTCPAVADTDICGGDVFSDQKQSALYAHCIPYQCLYEQLWIPLSAELDIPLTRHEFLKLANPDLVYVWHPTAGLSGAEATELLSCADLLRRPTEQFANWNIAVAGPEFNSRLLSIRSSMPLSMDEILDSGKEDIGESADQIQWQPESKSGPTLGDVVGSGVNPIMSGIAKLVLSFTGRAPGTAKRRTWLNDLEDWAKSRLAGVSEKTFQRRNRELLRLLEMLGSNPDQGLRYALPVDSLHSHRGRVQPGGELTRQDIKFDLSRLGGGRPADVWDIPPTIQRELTGKYRELAEREIALGRYKRAAYVYAHLLADLTAAARALENGKHYREAAVLYRDKLKDNLAAIRCLERGGLWSEAIVLLKSLQMDEQAGDLYLKLEQPERAAECYRRVVQRYCNQGNYVSAAKVEEEKLDSPESALATLSVGFGQNHPAACLTQIFRLLANTGQHHQSQAWIERSRQRTTEQRHLIDVLRLLSSVATDYPDQTTQHKAADTVKQVISESLAQQRPVSIPALLEPLAKLAPGDRLLSRDCLRYASGQQSQSTPLKARSNLANATRKNERVTLVNSFQLNDHREQWGRDVPGLDTQALGTTQWVQGIPIEQNFLAFGVNDNFLVAQHVDWTGANSQVKCLRMASPLMDGQLIVKATPMDKVVAVTQVGAAIFGTDSETGASFEWRFDSQSNHSVLLQNPPNVANEILGLEALSFDSWAQLRWHNQALVLETVWAAGGTTSLVLRHQPEIESLQLPIPLLFTGTYLLVAVGRELLVVRESNVRVLRFASPIRRLACNIPYTRTRVALGFDYGVAFVSNILSESNVTNHCPDFENATVQLTRSGHLIVGTEEYCEVFDTRKDKLTRIGGCAMERPLAIVRTNQSEEFATLNATGRVHRYRIAVG